MIASALLRLSVAALAIPLAVQAAAQAPQPAPASQGSLRVGATVTDEAGGTVGTITAIDADTLTLRTDRHEARLPVSSFRATAAMVRFGMTQAQLNAAVEQASAQAQAAFTVGATVRGRNGATVGTVTAVDDQTVTVRLPHGEVRIPRSGFSPTPQGLVVNITAEELQAATTPDSDSLSGGDA